MAIDPQIPIPAEVLESARQKLISLRPNALKAINYGQGVYSHLFEGWSAQINLEVARLANRVVSGRLALASGQELLDLLASEYNSFPETGPDSAIGEVVLYRGLFNYSPQAGVIKKGTRFNRPKVSHPVVNTYPFTLSDASYVSTSDVFVPAGVFATPFIPVKAVAPGSASNTPVTTIPYDPEVGILIGSAYGLKLVDTIFDQEFATPVFFLSAGGRDGTQDSTLRLLGTARYQGQYAPIDAALVAGMYECGVRKYQLIDQGTGTTFLYVADDSWSSSLSWMSMVRQKLVDNECIGFGSNVVLFPVWNSVINVTAAVKLKSGDMLGDTSEITDNIQRAVRAYFDDRNDWNIWKYSTLRSVITNSDKRIRFCSSVNVNDAFTGTLLLEPAQVDFVNTPPTNTLLPPEESSLFHYSMSDNALSVSYSGPT